MSALHGLTWDHPRGSQALRAAATHQAAPCDIHWDVQPLEGFESAPIGANAERHDLLVLDHPHLGEAVRLGALRPLDDVFESEDLELWRTSSVGACFDSYTVDGRHWALPLDAATQVSVLADPGIEAPTTWQDALELARDVPTTLPTSGPHLFLTLCSVAIGDGHQPAADATTFLPPDAVDSALQTLAGFDLHSPAGRVHNPISVLEQMATGQGPLYCPHVYGYVNYAAVGTPRPLQFVDAPRGSSGRIGSVLGGTGIALSARCPASPELLAHLRWLMSPSTQAGFLSEHAGQPSAAAAWESPALDEQTSHFYSATRSTIDQAWIRPRHDGAVAFQQHAAEAVRHSLFGDRDGAALAAVLDELHRTHLPTAS